MKKKVIIFLAVVVCSAVAVVAFLSVGRAGGEIGFEATINKVEDGIAYATVIEQDTGFLTKKLPESIMFETADLDKELNAGDKIIKTLLKNVSRTGHTSKKMIESYENSMK